MADVSGGRAWRRHRAGGILVLTAIALGTSACSGGAAGGEAAGDDGVTVSVYQPRTDVAAGRIAIEVHNDSDEELTVSSAELTSTFFTADLEWPATHEVRVNPGRAVDLRIELGESDCAEPNPAQHTVTMRYRLGDTAATTRTFTPADGFDALELLHDAACLVDRVAAVATLTAQSVAAVDAPGEPTTLTIAVAPTGAGGRFTIDAVNSTTLLAPSDGGVGAGELPLGVVVDASGPAEVIVPLVPNRCDPHALAEDKVGTRIPLQITAPDGSQGRLVLSATDALRGQMYAFYSTYCDLG